MSRKHRLGEPRAVDAKDGLAAPKVGGVEERAGGVEKCFFLWYKIVAVLVIAETERFFVWQYASEGYLEGYVFVH